MQYKKTDLMEAMTMYEAKLFVYFTLNISGVSLLYCKFWFVLV